MRTRVVLTGLLLMGAAACTSGPKAPVAADSVVPKQVMPSAPARPTPTAAPTESPALDEQTTAVFVRMIHAEDTGHVLDKLPDTQLASAADGACAQLRAGKPVGEVRQGLLAQGLSAPQESVLLAGAVTMGSDSLCPDQRQKYLDWRASGAS